MAHQLRITDMPTLEVGHKDVVFRIKTDDGVMGHLHVSKGRIEWKPKYGIHHYAFGWRRFADLAVELGRKRKASY